MHSKSDVIGKYVKDYIVQVFRFYLSVCFDKMFLNNFSNTVCSSRSKILFSDF